MNYTGTAAVTAEVIRRTGTTAAIHITGGNAECDLAGNGISMVYMTAVSDAEDALAVLSSLAQAASAAGDDDMMIVPVTAAYSERRENGYVRWCQKYEIWYRGGL